jgi:ADP-ribose pyrophosphatase YjhB (NUDIX family)
MPLGQLVGGIAVPLAIRPGVAGVIRDAQGHVLLHRRRVGGGWAPPSGSLEPGEDIRAGLFRELREETALTVDIERLVGVYSDPAYQIIHYPDGRAVQFVTCLFACRLRDGDLQGSEEGTAWAWFSPACLPEDLTSYARIWLRDALSHDTQVVVR